MHRCQGHEATAQLLAGRRPPSYFRMHRYWHALCRGSSGHSRVHYGGMVSGLRRSADGGRGRIACGASGTSNVVYEGGAEMAEPTKEKDPEEQEQEQGLVSRIGP